MTEESNWEKMWNKVGKIFRGRKSELPGNCDYCSNCGRIFPREDLQEILMWQGQKLENFLICEECSELPPSSWRKRFEYKRQE